MSSEQIARLEALLARVKERAEMARPAALSPAELSPAEVLPQIALAVTATVPPTSDGRVALERESRTRVVESTVELDEADLVPVSQASPPPPVVEIEIDEPDEPPPPSSKRQIPMEAIAEAQKNEPPPPAPPESGKLVATVPAFDDDFTGVREASNLLPPLDADAPSIEVQHIETPKPAPVHEMEAELGAPPPGRALPGRAHVASAPRRISDVAPTPGAIAQLEPEITNASLAASPAVVEVRGTVQVFKPKSFGELVDATLDL